MIKLKNISSAVFGVSGNRSFFPQQTLEFDAKEAEKLLADWKGKIVNENASLEALKSKDEEIASLKKQLAEATGEEPKTLKSKKAKTFKEGETIAEEETGVEITNE
jgi:hypothetical protein